MDNPYGLASLWLQGDWVQRSVAITLLIMSISSWIVIVMKVLRLWSLRRHADSVNQHFWHAHDLEQAFSSLGDTARNPFRQLAEEARNAVAHHAQHRGDLHAQLNISDWLSSCLRRAMDDVTASLQSGLAVLATIGSTAPFIGLLGTVWGIYHALIKIGVSGSASIDKIAGPVGEALVMTAFGLFVAIPAVMAYNALTRGNKAIVMKLASFAHDLHAYFITGARVSSAPTLRAVGES